MFTRPSLGLAEIAWRWSIGFAAVSLLTACVIEYLDTLPVTNGDILFLRSRQPALISQAFAHILRGSSTRLVEAFVVVAIALAVAWIVVSSYGRVATLESLLAHFRNQQNEAPPRRLWSWTREIRSLIGLNFLRVAAAVAALVGCVGALLIAAAASPDRDPSPGSAFFIFLLTSMLVWIAWSGVNWFLSLAAVFVVSEGKDAFAAIADAGELCRREAGSVFAAGTWFGLAHVLAFFVATSVVAVPFAFIGVLPGAMILGGVLLVTLLYFAAADFLYVGRLGAYVAILELPDIPTVPLSSPAPVWPAGKQQLAPSSQPSESVDKTETILSDA
jgi:hypothetical protein